ncbi:uncharacterized protein LOC127736976 [Mytilus californianus]|uniref:uncharacterized protein LOC127736976 n=1 Tax=Mytilus californianus TaxID=6549 RepID=UPI0022478133|nr:uncharacterized protein LOC127736976 [Mytilus californianus]
MKEYYIGQAENSFNTNVNQSEDKHTIEITQSKPSVTGDHFLLEVDIPVSPVGKLRSKLHEWKAITTSTHIIDVIENGYKLPLKTEPGVIHLKNNRSSLNNAKFVVEEIDKLLQKRCISEIYSKPTVVNPLTVAFNKNKPRLVLDCRHLNPHLFKFRYKYEDTKIARDLFQKGDYLFSFDIRSAYHHLEISDIHRTFLGFAWNFDGNTRYFVFNVLPFGISTAGYIFTKVLREVVKHLRSEGKRIIMFLDDGLGGDSNFEKCIESSQMVKNKLEQLGFLIAHEKCFWLPSQKLKWLGYTWDTNIGKIFVNEDRIMKTEKKIRSLIEETNEGVDFFGSRFLASIVGQLISMQIVIGDLVRLNTRYLYDCIMSRASWDAPVKICKKAINEIHFWSISLQKLNNAGVDICKVDKHDIVDIEMFCDASDVGFGGYITTDLNAKLFCKEMSDWNKMSRLP